MDMGPTYEHLCDPLTVAVDARKARTDLHRAPSDFQIHDKNSISGTQLLEYWHWH